MLSEFADSKQTIEVVRASPYFSKSHGDDTSLYDAIFLGIENLSKAKNQKRILLVFGDGEDNNSQKTYKDVEKLIKEKNIAVYFINFADLNKHGSSSPLENIVKIFGGSVIYTDYSKVINGKIRYRSEFYSPHDYFLLSFSEFADKFQKQYVIGFKPNLDNKENKWRDIEIKLEISKEIKKKIGLAKVQHREGYYPFSEIVIDN